MLALADVLAASAASVAAAPSLAASARSVAFLPLWVLLAKLLGLYDRDHRAIRHLTIDELPAIAAWALAGAAMLAALVPATGAAPLSTGALATVCLVAGGSSFVLRGTFRWLWRQLTPRERTVVIGEGEFRDAIMRKAELFKDMHLSLVEPRDGAWDAATAVAASTNGDRAALERTLSEVDRAIVASADVGPDLVGELSALCRAHQVKLSVVSPLSGRACPAPRITQVADLPLFEYNTWDVSRSTMLLKRVFDVTVATAALLVTAPLIPLIALAVKLDSRGPILFIQRRAGLNGRPFRMYKFRTMRPDAALALPELISIDELNEPMFKFRKDPRVTRVGRVLRRLSLDELPQLVNVLRGEMSIVGPRPEDVDLAERYLPEHLFRLTVKPGMTGPMQVYGRGELTFAERLAVELDYVENMSLIRDIRMLFQTFPAIVRGTGAF
jgi:exopolysaccharide biosynthesis polyprenyl glycosylphosphotransferase